MAAKKNTTKNQERDPGYYKVTDNQVNKLKSEIALLLYEDKNDLKEIYSKIDEIITGKTTKHNPTKSNEK